MHLDVPSITYEETLIVGTLHWTGILRTICTHVVLPRQIPASSMQAFADAYLIQLLFYSGLAAYQEILARQIP